MKKALSYIALIIAAVCCVVAAYFCHFYYSLYRHAVTDLERSINSFDTRLGRLETHKSRELTPVRAWGIVSTTDHPLDEVLLGYGSSQRRATNHFDLVNAKGGPVIGPEFRLVHGSTNYSQFDIQIEQQFGHVTDAWLSHGEPYQDLAAFEHFWVYRPNGTNIVRLIIRPKQDASIKLRFAIVVLCER